MLHASDPHGSKMVETIITCHQWLLTGLIWRHRDRQYGGMMWYRTHRVYFWTPHKSRLSAKLNNHTWSRSLSIIKQGIGHLLRLLSLAETLLSLRQKTGSRACIAKKYPWTNPNQLTRIFNMDFDWCAASQLETTFEFFCNDTGEREVKFGPTDLQLCWVLRHRSGTNNHGSAGQTISRIFSWNKCVLRNAW